MQMREWDIEARNGRSLQSWHDTTKMSYFECFGIVTQLYQKLSWMEVQEENWDATTIKMKFFLIA